MFGVVKNLKIPINAKGIKGERFEKRTLFNFGFFSAGEILVS